MAGDVTTPGLVLSVILREKIDTIMHFAAHTHVDCSFADSMIFTQNNVVGTHAILEACRSCQPQIRRFVHVSTDEVYGENVDNDEQGFLETDPLNPTNPYAASKASAEMLVKAYIKVRCYP